jgi:hypothetical protein
MGCPLSFVLCPLSFVPVTPSLAHRFTRSPAQSIASRLIHSAPARHKWTGLKGVVRRTSSPFQPFSPSPLHPFTPSPLHPFILNPEP